MNNNEGNKIEPYDTDTQCGYSSPQDVLSIAAEKTRPVLERLTIPMFSCKCKRIHGCKTSLKRTKSTQKKDREKVTKNQDRERERDRERGGGEGEREGCERDRDRQTQNKDTDRQSQKHDKGRH